MKLVIIFSNSSEKLIIFPVEYKAPIDLCCDLTVKGRKAYKNGINEFILGGYKFKVSDFLYPTNGYTPGFSWPDVLTIDEWFLRYCRIKSNRMNNMRLVVSYWVGSEYDGQGIIFPAEYESAEALLCDIERECKACYDFEKKIYIKHSFKIGGYTFYVSHILHHGAYGKISFDLPEIYTVDEWFEKHIELKG
ncbi:hypothetical protein KKF61_07805 [Patescibacteria group bacterium]|nr:hypothetical protein [Patescibacteria group bacterium]